ncbi:MAG: CBS domain-containing protein [Desulfurococcales archaeon]|nr:CBS domain-containing protein [Desulfurococcales archaeon]
MRSLLSIPLSSLKFIEAPIVDAEDSYGEVRRVFRESGARIVAVEGARGEFLGVIYRSSVLRVTSRKTQARARDLASDPPATLTPSNTLLQAVNLMLKLDEWYLPVVSEGLLEGFVGLEHAIRVLLDTGVLRGLSVGDSMTRDPIAVKPSDPLSKVWSIMVEKRYAGLPVVADDGRLAGIVTQYDLIRKGYTRLELESSGGPHTVKVLDAMNPSVEYTFSEKPLEVVAEMILSRGYGRIPVVDSSERKILVGVVDREDVVKAALRRWR